MLIICVIDIQTRKSSDQTDVVQHIGSEDTADAHTSGATVTEFGTCTGVRCRTEHDYSMQLLNVRVHSGHVAVHNTNSKLSGAFAAHQIIWSFCGLPNYLELLRPNYLELLRLTLLVVLVQLH